MYKVVSECGLNLCLIKRYLKIEYSSDKKIESKHSIKNKKKKEKKNNRKKKFDSIRKSLLILVGTIAAIVLAGAEKRLI